MKSIFALFFLLSTLLGIQNIAFAAALPLPPNQGGTGQNATPSYGQILVGNSSGTLTLSATSSLGLSTIASLTASGGSTGLSFSGSPCSSSCTLTLTGTLAAANGGTGNTTYSRNALLYFDGTNISATSSSPLYVGSISATTSTATSTFFGAVGIGVDASNANALTELTHSAASRYDPLANTAMQANYALSLHNILAANGSSTGICFSVTNTYGNCGGALIFTRTNSNSMGALSLWTKQSGTGGAALTQALTVSDSGKVGIGTSSPAFFLDARGGVIRTSATGADSGLIVSRDDGKGGLLAAGVGGAGFNFDSTGKFAIGSSPRATINAGTYSGTDMLTILNTGLVGIGTSTPSFIVDTYTAGTTTIRMDNSSGSKGACLIMKDSDGVGYTYVTANNGTLTASTIVCN